MAFKKRIRWWHPSVRKRPDSPERQSSKGLQTSNVSLLLRPSRIQLVVLPWPLIKHLASKQKLQTHLLDTANLPSAAQQEWRNAKYSISRESLCFMSLETPTKLPFLFHESLESLLYTRICLCISPVLWILFIWLRTPKLFIFCLPFSAVTGCQNCYSSLWYLWLKESLLAIRGPSAQCHWVPTHSPCLSSEILDFLEWVSIHLPHSPNKKVVINC